MAKVFKFGNNEIQYNEDGEEYKDEVEVGGEEDNDEHNEEDEKNNIYIKRYNSRYIMYLLFYSHCKMNIPFQNL